MLGQYVEWEVLLNSAARDLSLNYRQNEVRRKCVRNEYIRVKTWVHTSHSPFHEYYSEENQVGFFITKNTIGGVMSSDGPHIYILHVMYHI
jgi:hypothetical protein